MEDAENGERAAAATARLANLPYQPDLDSMFAVSTIVSEHIKRLLQRKQVSLR